MTLLVKALDAVGFFLTWPYHLALGLLGFLSDGRGFVVIAVTLFFSVVELVWLLLVVFGLVYVVLVFLLGVAL